MMVNRLLVNGSQAQWSVNDEVIQWVVSLVFSQLTVVTYGRHGPRNDLRSADLGSAKNKPPGTRGALPPGTPTMGLRPP